MRTLSLFGRLAVWCASSLATRSVFFYLHALAWIVGGVLLGNYMHGQELYFNQPRNLPFANMRWTATDSSGGVLQVNQLVAEGTVGPFAVLPGVYTVDFSDRDSGNAVSGSFTLEAGKRYLFRMNPTAADPAGFISVVAASLPEGAGGVSSVVNIVAVFAQFLALGVTSGGLIFASRYLWCLFQRLLGGPTWRD